MNHTYKQILVIFLMSSIAFGQRKPDPPSIADVNAAVLSQFETVYNDEFQPKLSIQTVAISNALDTSQTVEVYSLLSEIDNAVKSEFLNVPSLDLALTAPGLYLLNEVNDNPDVYGAIDPWGNVRFQVVNEKHDEVLESLDLLNPNTAALAVGVRDDADLVLLTKILIGSEKLSGEYVLLDVGLQRVLLSHSWEFSSRGLTTDNWKREYGANIATHVMRGYVDRDMSSYVSRNQKCELKIRSSNPINMVEFLSYLRTHDSRINQESVRLIRQEQYTSGTQSTVRFSWKGDLANLSDLLTRGLQKQVADEITLVNLSNSSIFIVVGQYEQSKDGVSPNVELMRQCVPNIHVEFESKEGLQTLAYGSGFIVTSDGFLLTNRHVIESETPVVKIELLFCDGTKQDAEVVYTSNRLDIAVLKTNRKSNFLRFAKEYQIGDRVFAFGYPVVASELLNAASSEPKSTSSKIKMMPFTVTQGILSAKEEVGSEYGTLLVTDAAVYSGNSGGPLTSASGEVLGVSTIGHPLAESVNGAISWESIRDDMISAGFDKIQW